MWSPIDRAVHDEFQRTKIAVTFLSLYRVGADTTKERSDPNTNPQSVTGRQFSLAKSQAWSTMMLIEENSKWWL